VRGIFRTRRRPDRALYRPKAAAQYKVIIDETTGASDEESLTKRGLAYWMLGRTAKQNQEFENAASYSREAALTLEDVRRYALLRSALGPTKAARSRALHDTTRRWTCWTK
jgi:hypothetical protein